MALAASFINARLAEVTGREPVGVAMLTAAGDDADGRRILNFCRDAAIGTDWFALMPLLPDEKGELTRNGTASWEFVADTGAEKKQALVYHNRKAENCPIDRLFRETCGELTGFLNSIDVGTIFVVSGIAASRPFGEDTFETMLDFIRDAKGRGAKILIDPNTRLRLFKSKEHAQERLSRLFRLAHFVLPSFPDDLRPQGNAVFPWETPDAVRDGLFALGVENVIIKLAESGSIWFRRDGSSAMIPTSKVEDPNTAGAGDAYLGGFALALASGLSVEQAMRLATCAAVQKVKSKHGATLAPKLIPSSEQICAAVN